MTNCACGKPAKYSSGLCGTCYQRERRNNQQETEYLTAMQIILKTGIPESIYDAETHLYDVCRFILGKKNEENYEMIERIRDHLSGLLQAKKYR